MNNAVNDTVRLSIVTVVLNDLEGLKRTVESVKSLDFSDYEYIVVDGGSGKDALAFIENEPSISKWISESDSGIYDAMNKGIRMSSGNYIHLLNAGDVYHSPGVFDSSLFDDGRDFLAWSVKKISEKNTVWKPHQSRRYNSFRIAHPGLIVRRSFYQKSELYLQNYSLISDSIFILKNVREGNLTVYENILVDMDGSGISTLVTWRNIYERHALINHYNLNLFEKFMLHIRTSIFFLKKIF